MLDAQLSPSMLKPMLQRTVARSYNQISVDGDTSTNDTLLLLANGASQIKPTEKERKVIEEVLSWVMEDLAEQIARDGEGARKLITIRVSGAPDDASAGKIARTIANSPLVKTAIAGSDPNWGRIICAAGNAGVAFDPNKIDISIQGVQVCRQGLAADFSEQDLKAKLDARDCLIKLEIRGRGRGTARFWTCDFTKEYIEINGSYRT
jgi:glutamate N-acetyltransferase/amino-acid N-acetyltransferase